MRDLFLLGTERSGSTWLANILDAHPAVDLVMEPFADYAGLFPEIPDRNVCVEHGSAELCRALQAGYARLPGFQHPWLYRPGRSPWLRRGEQRAVQGLRRVLRRGAGLSPQRLERYVLLQLNSLETPSAHLTRKRRPAALRVTKELRLNFKVPLLREAFPEARFLVVLRHPGAQIASILAWMQRGRLGELSRALTGLRDAARGQERLRAPAEALFTGSPEDGLVTALAAWWALQHAVLLADLERVGAPHTIVRYERLAQDAGAEVEGLLGFAGLDAAVEVERYVAWSAAGDPRGGSPTETVRRSAAYAREAMAAVPPSVEAALRRVRDRLRQAGLLDAGLEAAFEAPRL